MSIAQGTSKVSRGTKSGAIRKASSPPYRPKKASVASVHEGSDDGRLAKGALLAALGIAGVGIVATSTVRSILEDPSVVLLSSLSVQVINKSLDAALTLDKARVKDVLSSTEDVLFSLDEASLEQFVVDASKAVGSKGSKQDVNVALNSATRLASTAKKEPLNRLLSVGTSAALSVDKGKGIDVAWTALDTAKEKDKSTADKTVKAATNLLESIYPPGNDILQSSWKTISTINPKLLEEATVDVSKAALTADPALVREALDDVEAAIFTADNAATFNTVKAFEYALSSCESKCDEASLQQLNSSFNTLLATVDPSLVNKASNSIVNAVLSVDKDQAIHAVKAAFAAGVAANPASLIETIGKGLPLVLGAVRLVSSNPSVSAAVQAPPDLKTGLLISALAPSVLVLLRSTTQVESKKTK